MEPDPKFFLTVMTGEDVLHAADTLVGGGFVEYVVLLRCER
jgi:hypothetical protein